MSGFRSQRSVMGRRELSKFIHQLKTKSDRVFICPYDGKKRVKPTTVTDHFEKCDQCEEFFVENNLTKEDLWTALAWDDDMSTVSGVSDVSNISGANPSMKVQDAEEIAMLAEFRAKKSAGKVSKEIQFSSYIEECFDDLEKVKGHSIYTFIDQELDQSPDMFRNQLNDCFQMSSYSYQNIDFIDDDESQANKKAAKKAAAGADIEDGLDDMNIGK